MFGLMEQTFTAGYALAKVRDLGPSEVLQKLLVGDTVDIGPAPQMRVEVVEHAVANVLSMSAMPASPDVAEAMRKSAS